MSDEALTYLQGELVHRLAAIDRVIEFDYLPSI